MARSPGFIRWPTCWACATFKNRKTEITEMSDRLLVLVRHGQSDWNLKNLFTGWKDPDLTEQGIAEARDAGRKLKAQGLSFDIAFTSVLLRAQHTLDLTLESEEHTSELQSRENLVCRLLLEKKK